MFRWGIIFLVIALIAAALGFGGLAFTVLAVNVLRYLVSLEKNEKQEGRGGPANTGYARQYCAVIINTVPARPYGAGL